MAIAIVNGTYLIESDSGNDDWISDHAGDPENIDTSLFTEGTDKWYAEYTTTKPAPTINLSVDDMPGYFSVDTSMEEGFDMVKITGTYQGTTFATTLAKRNNLNKFCRNHSDLSDNVFYYVKRWDTNSYDLFYDATRTERKYMKCLISAWDAVIEERVLHFTITIRSCWG